MYIYIYIDLSKARVIGHNYIEGKNFQFNINLRVDIVKNNFLTSR